MEKNLSITKFRHSEQILSVRLCPFVISRFHCISNIVSNIYYALTKKPFCFGFFFTPYLIYERATRALYHPPPPPHDKTEGSLAHGFSYIISRNTCC